MKVDDIKELDWRKDKHLLVVEQKLQALIDREKKESLRMEELERIVHDGEPSLIQARAAEMLGEPYDESAEDIQSRLESARREATDLRSNIEALKLAQTRLEPAVKAAQSEAKLRVASTLAPVLRKTTDALREQLEKAAELNQTLHAIHRQSLRCDLGRETHGSPELKPLAFLLAWNYISLPNGQPSPELARWHSQLNKLYAAN